MCDEKKSTYSRAPRVTSRPPSRLSVSSANSRTRLANSRPTAIPYSAGNVAAAREATARCSAAVGDFGCGVRGPADELAKPQLEHQQGPDVRGAIGAAGEMLVDQRLDGLGSKVAARQRR